MTNAFPTSTNWFYKGKNYSYENSLLHHAKKMQGVIIPHFKNRYKTTFQKTQKNIAMKITLNKETKQHTQQTQNRQMTI